MLGWRIGESAHLPQMCPRFNSRSLHHMWVEFVFGLLHQSCNFFFRINALEEQIESQKVTTGKQVEEESFKHKLALVGFLFIQWQ